MSPKLSRIGVPMSSDLLTLFQAQMEQSPDSAARVKCGTRRAEYLALVAATATLLTSENGLWRQLPATIREIFEHRGWAWNGIYVLKDHQLELAAAAGPPVCHTLIQSGGVGTSGMCFDALLLNQTQVSADVKSWPGYVSCDGESGLATQAGLVCPIRGEDGNPVAVWDLDCTQALEPEDAPFFDRLFQVLSLLLKPGPAKFL